MLRKPLFRREVGVGGLAGISKKLMEYKGVRIAETELRDYLQYADYHEYCEAVNNLVQNGIITPVKSSGSNGMNPPLYKRYSIIKPRLDYERLIPEIRLLHGRLNIEGYLADPGKYVKHKGWLSQLDSFLKARGCVLEAALSINERSFQIFGKEKALKDDSELAGVLNFNPGLRETLNYYETPEPFFTYDIVHQDKDVPHKENDRDDCCTIADNETSDNATAKTEAIDKKMNIRNILIIENKDTWYTLRSLMSSGLYTIAGIRFDSLIYGEGKKIARKKDTLTDFNSSFYGTAETCYYYFGDLDYEGICIIQDLIKTNPTLQIEVFKPFYLVMLKEAEELDLPLPDTKENQNKRSVDWFVSLFERAYQDRILDILHSGSYIPQEILNRQNMVSIITKR